MENEDVALREVLALLRQEFVGAKEHLDAESTLFGDLYIYGDDAAELMETIHHRLNVDLSQFVFDNHFLPEVPFMAVTRLFNRYFSSTTLEESENLIPITVGRLAEAVRTKRWLASWSKW